MFNSVFLFIMLLAFKVAVPLGISANVVDFHKTTTCKQEATGKEVK